MSSGGRYFLRVMETWRSVFYAPVYVAVAGGFWAGEGLDVEFGTCPVGFSHPLSALRQGAADVVQSGIMRSIIALDWGAETAPLHFAKINARDGFFIVGRRRQEVFDWGSLRGGRVIPVGFSPMPWASLQFALRRHGVDPGELDLVAGLGPEEAVAAFREGRGEYVHLAEPAVEQLLAEGSGYLLAALGPENGPLAYSSFAATHRFLEGRGDAAGRFTLGFGRALRWLAAADDWEAAAGVGEFFPGVSVDVLAGSIGRYKAQGQWPDSPALGRAEYDNLHDILLAAGLCRERQAYERVVRADVAGLGGWGVRLAVWGILMGLG